MRKIAVLFILLSFCFMNSVFAIGAEQKINTRNSIPRETFFLSETFKKFDEKDLPSSLKGWVKWATDGYEADECMYGFDNSSKYCSYISKLKIEVSKDRFSFILKAKILKDGYLRLVGSESAFPLSAFFADNKLPIVSKNGLPYVYLKKGDYLIKGSGKANDEIRYLQIPENIGILEVVRNGKEIFSYDISSNGILRFEAEAEVKKADTDNISVNVSRKIKDDIPLQMTVRMELNVSGKERVENLGKIVPENFILKDISSRLPAYIQKDGNLIAEVRAGKFVIEMVFRQLKESLDITQKNLFNGEEIWVIEKNKGLRVIEAPANLFAIDTKSANLPSAWQKFPAYLVKNGESVVLKAIEHTLEHKDTLSLLRDIKLSFDGEYYSVKDNISADLKNNGRLLLDNSFSLSSAEVDGNPVAVTKIKDENESGIEVRKGNHEIIMTSRIANDGEEIKASGYNRIFDKVVWNLFLSPGYKLFHVIGANKVSNSWVSHWDLLGAFQVLVLGVIFYYLFGIKKALLSEALFILMHPLFPEFVSLCLFLSAVCFVLRYLHAESILKTMLIYIKNSMLIFLALQLIVLMIPHLREAIYPGMISNINIFISSYFLLVFYFSSFVIYILYLFFKKSDKSVIKKVFSVIGILFLLYFILNSIEVSTIISNHRYEGRGDRNDTVAIESIMYKSADRGLFNIGKKKRVLYDEMATLAPSAMFEEKSTANVQKYQNLNVAKNMVQTGLGFPMWKGDSSQIVVSGPVSGESEMKLLLICPMVNLLLAFVRLFLSIFVLYVMFDKKINIKGFSKKVVLGALLCLSFGLSGSLKAEEIPSNEVLRELRTKLTRTESSKCRPNSCISYPKAIISNEGNSLKIKLLAYSLEPVVAPLPEVKADGFGYVKIKEVTVNGKKDTDLTKINGKLGVSLNSGENNIEIDMLLDNNSERFIFSSSFYINNIEDKFEGFSFHKIQGSAQEYQINRKDKVKEKEKEKAKQSGIEKKIEVEPFFAVYRNINAGVLWEVETRIIKETASNRIESITIPLIKGEKVISAEGTLGKDMITVSFAPNENVKYFKSMLPVENKIILNSPKSMIKYKEIWSVLIDSMWNFKISGLNPALGNDEHMMFYPTADKSLEIDISLPVSIEGNIVTFDKVNYVADVSKDFLKLSLQLDIRSSEGGFHSIVLPKDAEVKNLIVENNPYPISIKDGKLSIPLLQGNNRIRAELLVNKKMDMLFKMPIIDLQAPAVDIRQEVNFPEDRWVVFTKGSVKGSVVLFWGMLPILLTISFILGRFKIYPLNSFQWFLLLLGLSQIDMAANVIIISWFIFMGLREKYSDKITMKKTVQIGLGIFSILFVSQLLLSIKTGLLGYPKMMISNGREISFPDNFNWYTDAISGNTPEALVVSFPEIVYKGIMLLWATWLAISVVKWAKWGVDAYTKDDIWVKPSEKKEITPEEK